jgi:hypothetical protein
MPDQYCGVPAICLELKCWEGKKCDIGEKLTDCPELMLWKKKNPGKCEFCGVDLLERHHLRGCPKRRV